MVQRDVSHIKPPSTILTALEMFRTPFETMSLIMSSNQLSKLPKGDGHSVLVLPGFATDDNATVVLRQFLTSQGYDVHPWRLGWNLDHRTVGNNGEHVAQRIDEIAQASGDKVSLIGWSLGGVIAREAARRDPETVRQVITLGSPFGGNPKANKIKDVYEKLSGNRVDCPMADRRFAIGEQPLDVPSTSIFSKSDGISAWQNCISLPHPMAENVEVHSSHFGLVVNPNVYHVIGDRLAQPKELWTPYVVPVKAAS